MYSAQFQGNSLIKTVSLDGYLPWLRKVLAPTPERIHDLPDGLLMKVAPLEMNPEKSETVETLLQEQVA